MAEIAAVLMCVITSPSMTCSVENAFLNQPLFVFPLRRLSRMYGNNAERSFFPLFFYQTVSIF